MYLYFTCSSRISSSVAIQYTVYLSSETFCFSFSLVSLFLNTYYICIYLCHSKPLCVCTLYSTSYNMPHPISVNLFHASSPYSSISLSLYILYIMYIYLSSFTLYFVISFSHFHSFSFVHKTLKFYLVDSFVCRLNIWKP